MGNRAHVIFSDKDFSEFSPAVYLHWNGGPESVYAFLDELDRRKIRGGEDLTYQTARFVHVVGDFFDQDEAGGLSLGISNGPGSLKASELKPFDHGDNGVFVIYRNGTDRTVRRFTSGYESNLREWTPKEVETERMAAYKPFGTGKDASDYSKDLAATFLRVRPKIAKHG